MKNTELNEKWPSYVFKLGSQVAELHGSHLLKVIIF